VRIQRGDAVRAKLAALGLIEADVADAVRWARSGTAAAQAAEPPARYTVGKRRSTAAPKRKPARRS
jgi:hypothetical protein